MIGKTPISFVLLLGLSVRLAPAADYLELSDAGQVVALAQEVTVVGQVASIAGSIAHAHDVDLYHLAIDQPDDFSATVIPAVTDAPDLQLFLFDLWGHGVVASDNWLLSPYPQIPVTTLRGHAPGGYLLGVSPADADPLGLFGEIFPDAKEGLSFPTGVFRISPLTSWSRDFTAVGGSYRISLSAVRGLIPPLEADFDEDGDVDSDDLAQWKGDFGLNGDSDADGDLDSDGADFLTWQRQFGSGVPLQAETATVPEPATWMMLLLGMAALKVARQRRRIA